MTVLVTGATGLTGGATVRALARAGIPARVLVRDPARWVAAEGVEVAVGSFEDAASLDAALRGVQHAYLVSPPAPQQVELETRFVEAARRAGVHLIVRLSASGADRPGIGAVRLPASHQRAEQMLRESGIAWTMLRPTGFMQNYLGQAASIAGEGAFYTALSPGARIAHIDVEDIGEVAAKVLVAPGHEGEGYALTGPEALSDDQVADRMSAALGRTVRHVEIPMAAQREAMLAMGMSEYLVDGLSELSAVYESGAASAVSPQVSALLGRPPRSFEDFVTRHAQAFRGGPPAAS